MTSPTSYIDPDVDATRARPLHLRGRYLYVVFVGGVLGTMARWSLAEWLPPHDGWPVGTMVANLLGALLLGMLLEILSRLAPDRGWPRLARLHFGTGFMGAFTTMSTLATETVLLADHHRTGLALGYLACSLVGGLLLAGLGIVLGGRLAQGRLDRGEAAR